MDATREMPATLNDAMAADPLWLKAWVMCLVVVNLAAIFFVVKRTDAGLRPRVESIAIVVSFLLAGAFMGWLYEQVGYVRLLGLAHLVFWGPVWVWLLSRRARIGTASLFGKYAHLYLAVAGTSLVIDVVDVVRYLLGDDGSLLG